MNLYQDGLKRKRRNLFRNVYFKSWVLFLLSAGVAFLLVQGLRLYFAKTDLYTKFFYNKEYESLKLYDKQLQNVLMRNYTEKDIAQIEKALEELADLRQKYSGLYLEPQRILHLPFIGNEQFATDFNQKIKDRIKEIDDFVKQLKLLKIYGQTLDMYSKFDVCVKKVDFGDKDKVIANQLKDCLKIVDRRILEENAKDIGCKELLTLLTYFDAYSNLVKYYELLDKKKYKEAKKYRELAEKKMDVVIDWNKCFPFLKK